MFRDFDFISSTQFPEKSEYMERLIADTIDEPNTMAGSIPFKFRQHVDENGYVFPIPGLRTQKKTYYKIETKAELPFKSGDVVRFNLNSKQQYTITGFEYRIDKRNEEEYQLTNQDWNGIAQVVSKIKILTLQ